MTTTDNLYGPSSYIPSQGMNSYYAANMAPNQYSNVTLNPKSFGIDTNVGGSLAGMLSNPNIDVANAMYGPNSQYSVGEANTILQNLYGQNSDVFSGGLKQSTLAGIDTASNKTGIDFNKMLGLNSKDDKAGSQSPLASGLGMINSVIGWYSTLANLSLAKDYYKNQMALQNEQMQRVRDEDARIKAGREANSAKFNAPATIK